LILRHPRLFHMAEEGTWASIQQHGLLSTSSLLDLFQVAGEQRRKIESLHRLDSVRISHSVYGEAVIRDQKPMSDALLERCLQDGLSPQDWYETLNKKVFFWLTEERLQRLLAAKPYRNKTHCVLTVDTARLVEKYRDMIVLAPINTGCARPNPQPRGKDTFLAIDDYPFEEWDRKRRGRDPVVELAVEEGVPDIVDLVLRVEHRKGRSIVEVVHAP